MCLNCVSLGDLEMGIAGLQDLALIGTVKVESEPSFYTLISEPPPIGMGSASSQRLP